jgi:hypothetical protein
MPWSVSLLVVCTLRQHQHQPMHQTTACWVPLVESLVAAAAVGLVVEGCCRGHSCCGVERVVERQPLGPQQGPWAHQVRTRRGARAVLTDVVHLDGIFC